MEPSYIITTFLDIKLFGIKLIDTPDFFELLIRFFFNFLIIGIIVRYFYYPSRRRIDYYFTYILMSTTIFMLCFLLENVKLQLGFALGLFAVFGIIRYRTSQIPIKEMTYLFVIIGISIINSLTSKKISYIELITANLLILGVLALFEKVIFNKVELRKTIIYEKIELIKPENRKLLLQDLEQRTGLKIRKIEIGRIDFMRDIARIRIFYRDEDSKVNFINIEDTDQQKDKDN
ncbi:MAG: DUF4956 domain-containing protein [Chlorobi bacterium]|nr:DUF4956 domain-containing protein [Chlorobiota bacterium]